MEKIIHILPKLITNEDSQWLRKIVKDPDGLSRYIVKNFNTKLYLLSIMKRASYNADMLGGQINDNSSVDELIDATKNLPETEEISILLEELKNRVDCNEKSATSIIWAASILNNLEELNVDQEAINKVFFAVAATLVNSQKNISDLREELTSLVSGDEKLARITKSSLVTSLVENPKVQKSDIYYDFNTFKEIQNDTEIEIKSKEDLFEALATLDNYDACVNYIKKEYLSEKDPSLDGYCENDNDRTYKALIITIALASEVYKHNAEFDKDNNIGFNMIANIYKLRDNIKNEHIFAEISNKINGLEFAAGRIATQILGRELEIGKKQDRIFNLPKEMFKTGNAEDYIKNNLNAFGKLIKTNLDYSLDLLNTIKNIKKKYQAKSNYRKSERTEETINFLAKELDVNLMSDSNILTPLGTLMENLNTLENACDEKHKQLSRFEDIYKKVKTKQKTNLKIQDVKFDKRLLGKNVALKTEYHENLIKEIYKLVELDANYAIKGDKNKTFYIASPKTILSKFKKNAEAKKETLPIINDLFKHFSLKPNEVIKQIAEEYYVNNDGSVNKDYENLYKTLLDKKTTKEDKIDVLNNAEVNEEDKDLLNKLL